MSDLELLLVAVENHVRRYVVLSKDQAGAVALWVAHTWALDAAVATAYLSVTSAEKQSGKTLLLEVLRPLVARPWLTGHVSAAVLVRKIDDLTPSLLLDESDAAFSGDKEYAEVLRGALNSGYRRGGAYSVCTGQGAKITYKDFSTFCPKAIAGIGDLPDTVADRSIRIRLKRKAPGETADRYRERKVTPLAKSIASGLEEWAADEATIEILRDAEPELPESISDRAADVWEPLIAIADLAAGGGWPERARAIAERLSAPEEADEGTLGVRLLSDCRAAFDGRDRIPTRDLLQHLHGLEDAPWGDFYGKPITPHRIGTLLRRYEIRVRKIRFEDGPLQGFERSAFEDAWSRYLPPPPGSKRNKRHNGSSKPETAPRNPEHGQEMFRTENPDKPHEQADVTDVPDSEGAPGDNGRTEAEIVAEDATIYCDHCEGYRPGVVDEELFAEDVAEGITDERDDFYLVCSKCGRRRELPCSCEAPELGDPEYVDGYCSRCVRPAPYATWIAVGGGDVERNPDRTCVAEGCDERATVAWAPDVHRGNPGEPTRCEDHLPTVEPEGK